jgi:hypothetical protein
MMNRHRISRSGGQIYPLTVKAEVNLGNIVSSLAQSYYGEAVTLTATFSATPTGSAPMTGTVAFYDGNTYLGTEPLIAAGAADLSAVSGTSSVSFYDGTTLLGTEPVSNGVAILNVGSLSPGSHSFRTVFSGGGTFSESTSSLVVSTEGPQVTGLRRYGFHWQPTYLLLNFNGPLDPTSAQNPLNYQVLGPGGHRITVVSAIYDPATQTVTLVPAERLNFHWKYSLTVNGATPAGLTNPSGVPLDGSGMGHIGSNYVTSITWRNLVGRASKLPTYYLVHQAPPPPGITLTSPQHAKVAAPKYTKVALHAAAVDHLLVTKSLRVPKKPLVRH